MTPQFTTVVTPATDRDLVTLDDLREQLRVRAGETANDSWYRKVIARSSRAAERYCNRIFAVQAYTDTFVTGSQGRPDEPLILNQAPVAPATLAVTLNGGAMDAADYSLDALVGHVWRNGTAWVNQSGLAVSYTAGFDEIPPDVQQAVLDLCTMENAARGRDPMLRATETPGMGRQEYWVGGIPGDSLIPRDIASLLNPYRRGMVG